MVPKMNLLTSFMGCMYPGSIRTESIESFEHDSQTYSFAADNLNEHGGLVSRGELQLKEDSLIYFTHGKFPTKWFLDWIRRYGCLKDGSDKFAFELGRKCPTGGAVYAFQLDQDAQELVRLITERIERRSPVDIGRQRSSLDGRLSNPVFHDRVSDTHDRSQLRSASTLTRTTADESKELADPRPLSYVMIDFDTTKALTDVAQSHAATRDR